MHRFANPVPRRNDEAIVLADAEKHVRYEATARQTHDRDRRDMGRGQAAEAGT